MGVATESCRVHLSLFKTCHAVSALRDQPAHHVETQSFQTSRCSAKFQFRFFFSPTRCLILFVYYQVGLGRSVP